MQLRNYYRLLIVVQIQGYLALEAKVEAVNRLPYCLLFNFKGEGRDSQGTIIIRWSLCECKAYGLKGNDWNSQGIVIAHCSPWEYKGI